MAYRRDRNSYDHNVPIEVAWLDPSAMYEFEVPHDLAGLVIGKEGNELKVAIVDFYFLQRLILHS